MTLPHGISDTPAGAYHADPALGSGEIKDILRAPAVYRWRRDHPREQSRTMALGSLAHAMILEPATVGELYVMQPDYIPRRAGRAWTEFRAEHEDQVIIKRGDWTAAEGIRDAVEADPLARALCCTGRAEVSLRWDDGETGTPCKGRVDRLPDADGEITVGEDVVPYRQIAVDLKTTASAHPLDWSGRSLARLGQHIQAGHYLRGLRALGEPREWWAWVVVEQAPPHLLAVYVMDRPTTTVGEELARRACKDYAFCVAAGEWPGYGDGPRLLGLSEWDHHAAVLRAAESVEPYSDPF